MIKKVRRPISITVACIIMFLYAAVISLTFLDMMSYGNYHYEWWQMNLAYSVVIILVSLVALWNMKQWGGSLYFGWVLLNQLLSILNGDWGLVGWFHIISILFSYFVFLLAEFKIGYVRIKG